MRSGAKTGSGMQPTAVNQGHAPWLFLLATLMWTWTFWVSAIFVTRDSPLSQRH